MSKSPINQYVVFVLRPRRGSFPEDIYGTKLINIETWYAPTWDNICVTLKEKYRDAYWIAPMPWDYLTQGMLRKATDKMRQFDALREPTDKADCQDL